MDIATAHNMVTDLLIGTFMPKSITEDKENASYRIVQRGISTITADIFRIIEDLYEDRQETAVQYRKDHDQMLESLRQISEVFIDSDPVPNPGGKAGEMLSKIRNIMTRNEYLD